ncbi:MAG: glycosyltransferase [Anaerolineales bacterium]|jgi:cellulose synthase/poly-beta-1,6-N-acetylglucosamine synthase-like glycosyltransferase
MITRALFLAGAWFTFSLVVMLLGGTHLRRTHSGLSLVWLAVVLGVGDAWALTTFGKPQEVFFLTGLTAALGLVFIWRLRDWNAFGQMAWLTTIIITPLFLVYAYSIIISAHLARPSFLAAQMFLFLQFIASLVALTHMFENIDVSCRVHWHRRIDRVNPAPGFLPMVSLHLPAYDEPPEVVEETLRALALLDYPAYEVLVVDNNTPEEKTWRPIEKLCQELGPRFRFIHLENWPGFKSGALNFALTQTSPSAELIGVIDADYQVNPLFLQELVPAFTDPQVAFIQAPQDYRDFEPGSFSEAMYYSYEYFFKVPMPVRNERNAIIFSGTMGLIRKSVLQEIGGWSEWCVTEDAEASLRVLKRGYKSLYFHRSLGRGLMPCTFAGLKKQRFRWCFGNIQILRKHWEALMPWAHWIDPENHLTQAQRYFYLAGCVQWFSDAFNFAFVCFLVSGGIIRLVSSHFTILPITGPWISLAFIFILLNLWRLVWVMRNALKLSWGLAFRSMYSMFSVGWVVTIASFQALIQSKTAFLRTPKTTGTVHVLNALFATQWEAGIGLFCLALGTAVLALADRTPNSIFIGGLLLWQSSLYLTSPIYGLFYKGCT